MSADVKKPMKKSKLVADPRPPPPAPAPTSGLDAVILLDVSDELSLLRAADVQRESLVVWYSLRYAVVAVSLSDSVPLSITLWSDWYK